MGPRDIIKARWVPHHHGKFKTCPKIKDNQRDVPLVCIGTFHKVLFQRDGVCAGKGTS